MTWLSRRRPETSAVRAGAAGGPSIASASSRDGLDAVKVQGSPVSPEGNSGGDRPFDPSRKFSEAEWVAIRERELRESFEILARSPVWNPHQPREERSSYPEDWFLVSS